jgi:pyruvate dehydrogenase E2 component (dihydrolipoamide acetyltransferase)
VATEIVMPRLSDSMEEGTVLSWIKSVGEPVALGEELVEIETDKANMVFEADAAGTLIEIVADEGDTLPIGAVIAWVGEAGETGGATGGAESDGAKDTEAPDGRADGRVKASPLARRMAAERGADLAALTGSGPGGRIVKQDVERALASGSAPTEEVPPAARRQPSTSSTAQAGPSTSLGRGEPPPALRPLTAPVGSPLDSGAGTETAKGRVETVELSRLQQTVARRMAESKATAPHFYLQSEIDMSRCFAARAQIKAAAGEDEVVPSFNDMVVKACAIALREFPRANGAYRDGRLELYERVNVGIAVAGDATLVVPTIFDADRKGLRQIAAEGRELAGRVRAEAITPPELSGATFTVSNLGMYGVASFNPVIKVPPAAILAVGAIAERPAYRDGELIAARIMAVTLACDHRILYGADGAQFLARVRELLEEPLGLAL